MKIILPPARHFNKCFPFNQEQSTFIIFKFGELQSIKRDAMVFKIKQPMCLPNILAFRRTLKRFKSHASVQPQQSISIKTFTRSEESFRRSINQAFQLCYGTIWRMLQKKLNWKAYMSHLAQGLSLAITQGLAACNYWLTFTKDWFQIVI